MLRRLLPCLLAGLLPLSAAADGRFEALHARSEPLGGLGAFLEKYVGHCDAVETRAACEARAKDFRRTVAGKRLYMLLANDAAHMLAPGPYDPDTGELTVLLTPIFGANGMALTSGTPKKTDGDGNPVMRVVKLKGKSDKGWTTARFQRLFAQQELRLELIFTPEDVWALRGKRGPVRGVQAKMLGVAVVHARSGETLATWTR